MLKTYTAYSSRPWMRGNSPPRNSRTVVPGAQHCHKVCILSRRLDLAQRSMCHSTRRDLCRSSCLSSAQGKSSATPKHCSPIRTGENDRKGMEDPHGAFEEHAPRFLAREPHTRHCWLPCSYYIFFNGVVHIIISMHASILSPQICDLHAFHGVDGPLFNTKMCGCTSDVRSRGSGTHISPVVLTQYSSLTL